MIKDAWKNTTFKCGNCNSGELTLDSKLNYTCSHCKSSISYLVIEKILDKVSELENEKYLRREFGSLEGTKFVIPKKAICVVENDNQLGAFTVNVKIVK